MRSALSILVGSMCALLGPAEAQAQWFAGVFLGANHTHSSSVTIEQPALDRSFTFDEVDFDGRPFESPQYYGWRVGRLLGSARRLGLELEFIHLKVIGRTDRVYPVSGLATAESPDTMDAVVQRYSMTHGLNFVLINLVVKTPLRGPFALMWRAGAGPTIPHAETTINHQPRDQYEFGGLGAQASIGVDIKTWRFLSTTAEYKFTIARPRIDVVDGTGVTTSATHQIAVGFAFGLRR